jgi:hypothetical protein
VSSSAIVDAWLFPVVHGASDDPSLFEVLGRDERARVARLGRRADRDRAVSARLAARIEAGRRLGISAAAVPLDDRGPPVIQGADVTVSWSHSGNWIALALASDRAVGIDIEQVPAHLDLRALEELDVHSLAEFVALEAASKATACEHDGAWPPGVAVRRLSAPDGYVAAVAARDRDWRVELHVRSPLRIVEGLVDAC